MSGKLYLVPTPIGNLEDITLRAIRILKECDLILAEDTRNAGILLHHLGITKKMFAHHQHNEHQAVPELIRMLHEGKIIAMISDAGTPGISDPGFLLLRTAIKEEIQIDTLPGATACIPAYGYPSFRSKISFKIFKCFNYPVWGFIENHCSAFCY